MNLLHTADWHLGKALYGRSLLEEQTWFVRDWLLPLIEERRPDAVLLAGDIFDRQVPPVEAVALLDLFFNRLAEWKIPLLAVTGNHDSARRLSLGTALLRSQGIVLATKPEQLLQPYRLQKDGQTVCFYMLPYCEPAAARQALGLAQEGPHTMDTAFRALLEQVPAHPTEETVLITHCFAAGGAVGASESPAFVGGSSQVGLDCFAPFSYVALGHLHGPQRAGENGRYAGSPLKYSFDEAKQKKGVLWVTLEDGQMHTTLLPVRPPHDVRVLRGTFEELLCGAKQSPSEDYLLVQLTDPHPVYQPVDRLRPYYPNLLGVSSEWLLAQGGQTNPAFQEEMHRRRVSDEEIFSAFLQQVCDTKPTEQDLALFRETMQEEEA